MTTTGLPDPSTAPQLPRFAVTMIQMLGQHGGTYIGGLLLGLGLITASQKTEVAEIGGSIALGLVSLGWTYLMHRAHANTAKAVATTAAITGQTPT